MRRSQQTKPKTGFQPNVEPCEPRLLLSTLPISRAAAARSGFQAAAHPLVQLPLTDSSIAGTLKGESKSAGKKYELRITTGHFYESGQDQVNSNRPVGGSFEYTVSKKNTNDTFVFKDGQITIHNLGSGGGEVIVELKLTKAEKKEDAKDVSEFVYSVKKATGSFKGTKAEGTKLIKFEQLWPPITVSPSPGEYIGTFS